MIAYCRGPYCILSFDTVGALRPYGFKVRRPKEGFPEWKLGVCQLRSAGPHDRRHETAGLIAAVCFRGRAHCGRVEPGPTRGLPRAYERGKSRQETVLRGGGRKGSGSRSPGELVSTKPGF